jgi:Raf kinase inhibitor-like YbhB/YbcL family protein
MRLLPLIAIVSAVVWAQAPGSAKHSGPAPGKHSFFLSAGGLPERSLIPRRFTCDGPGVSLPLSWSGEPEGTQSFALIMDDPDGRDFNHWLLWDIPASIHSLAEGAEPDGFSGTNDFGKSGYGAPCPPEGRGPHIYSFRLFALDVPALNLKARAHRDDLDKALKKHVLAKVEYRLQYGR